MGQSTPADETAGSAAAMDGASGAALLELLPPLGAIARAEGTFDPRRFLDAFSAQLQPLVPHDRIAILYIEDDLRTFSVFAERAGPGLVPAVEHYTTDFRRESRVPIADFSFRDVLTGTAMRVDDLSRSRRAGAPGGAPDGTPLRAGLLVPLESSGRQVGVIALARLSAEPYREAQLGLLRQVGQLIGPLIEHIVVLHRERRRRHRLEALANLPQAFAATLDVRNLIESGLAKAIRPILDVDVVGARLIGPDGARAEWAAASHAAGERLDLPDEQFSFGRRLALGEVILYRDLPTELDPAFPGDRLVIERGIRSLLLVPLRFAGEVGGTLAFGKQAPDWYEAADIEVATGIASQVVLAVQHQRLADEQRRAAVAEERARKLQERVASLRAALGDQYGFDRILGHSAVLREALARAEKVAPTEATVLITGESGTGKELVARAIHHASLRTDGPFEALNCAALPETLLESELFGHERGAFTGADRQKRGRFELAGGGTLFLDEAAEFSPTVQAKLLRVLQEREFQRLGGTVTLKADVRILAATNKNLEQEVAAGRFREDLFYRLNVFPIPLPPLRERGQDVLLLADAFVRDLAPQLGKASAGISREARQALLAHSWPGNIRELQNAIERALIMSDGGLLTATQLALPAATTQPQDLRPPAPAPGTDSGSASIAEMEKRLVVEALTRAKGNKSEAARRLGITRMQLYHRLKLFHIE